MSSNSPAISPREALDALESVREVERRTRRSISAGGGGKIMTLWGFAWFSGFLASHFLEGSTLGWVWFTVNLVGGLATFWVVSRLGRRVPDPVGARIGGLWIVLGLYCALWIYLASPVTGLQIGALIACIAMFGYVIMGLWLDRTFLWIGLSVTLLTVIGYEKLPHLFGLWMAFVGGGALIGAGLRIQRRWRA
jgi:hypothetical protein